MGDLKALTAFAKENLGPCCGPGNLDLCDDEKKALVKKFMAMSADDLGTEISSKEKEIKATEKEFEDFVKGLQAKYTEAQEKKDSTTNEIKNSGLGLTKSVLAHMKSAKSEL